MYKGPECFTQLVTGLCEDEGSSLMNGEKLPICFPCMAEILGKENMGLFYDAECSYMPGSSNSCGFIFSDYSLPSVPYTCLLRQTGAGIVPQALVNSLDSTCNSPLQALSSSMSCCGRIMNNVLDAVYMKGGWMGFQNTSCINDVVPVTFTLKGLQLSTAQGCVSGDVLSQMSADEIAHLVPALIKNVFIRNIRLQYTSPLLRDDADSVELQFDVLIPFHLPS